MRDGIFKDLPLGRGWKSLLKSCEREKERGSTAYVKATRAIISELNGALGAAYFQNLTGKIKRGESLLPGFVALEEDTTSRDLGGSNTPFENDLLSSTKRQLHKGLKGLNAIDAAMRESIENMKRRQFSHIQQHYLLKAGLEAKPTIDAAGTALGEVDSASLATQFRDSKRPALPKLVRPIDLNEDLENVK